MLDTATTNLKKKEHKFTKLRQADFVFIYEVMKGALTRDGDFAFYKDGWDDERIAEIGRTQKGCEYVTHKHVANMRRQIFGNYPPAKGPQRGPNKTERLDKLEQDMTKVLEFITSRGYKG